VTHRGLPHLAHGHGPLLGPVPSRRSRSSRRSRWRRSFGGSARRGSPSCSPVGGGVRDRRLGRVWPVSSTARRAPERRSAARAGACRARRARGDRRLLGAYRLTLLTNERLIVVPTNASEESLRPVPRRLRRERYGRVRLRSRAIRASLRSGCASASRRTRPGFDPDPETVHAGRLRGARPPSNGALKRRGGAGRAAPEGEGDRSAARGRRAPLLRAFGGAHAVTGETRSARLHRCPTRSPSDKSRETAKTGSARRRRAERKRSKKTSIGPLRPDGEDPDIAGIIPGPQPEPIE